MPYTHYTLDERNALQAMEGIALPKCFMLAIPGSHPGSIHRELNRNGTGGVYTGNEVQAASVQRRLDNKPSPRLDNPAHLCGCATKTCPRSRLQDGREYYSPAAGKTGFVIDYLHLALPGTGQLSPHFFDK
jgi:hypothetical protein